MRDVYVHILVWSLVCICMQLIPDVGLRVTV